ncbi:hypothetical protein L9F63_027944, partial [Diploptera punctata]
VETFEISSQTPATITSEDAVQTFKLEIQEIASQANNEELNADLTEKKRSRSEDEIERELKKLAVSDNRVHDTNERRKWLVETFEISSQTPATTTSEDAVQTFKLEIQEIASQTNNEELNIQAL